MLKNILLFALSICLPGNAHAQFYKQGYLLTIEGDTLQGYIKKPPGNAEPKTIHFKISTEEKTSKKYSPNNLILVDIDGKYYYQVRSLIRKGYDTPVFLRKLVSGKINLYFTKYKNEVQLYIENADSANLLLLSEKDEVQWFDRHYLMNHDIDVHPGTMRHDMYKGFNIQRDMYKGVLKYMMKDTPSLFAEIDNVLLNKNEITRLIVKYFKLKGDTDYKVFK